MYRQEDAQAAYTIMAMALRDSGRDIVFSICEWGTLNMAVGEKADVKDLWSKAVTEGVKSIYSAVVPAHGVVMVRIKPMV
jgi:alpha-galactosidase